MADDKPKSKIGRSFVKLVTDFFTEDDAGTMWDLIRSGAGAGIATYLGAGLWTVIHTGALDFIAFGTGFGALLGGSGAAIGAKHLMGADTVKDKPPTKGGE